MSNYKIEDLLIGQLEELYDSEKQIISALPKLQKEALNEDLKNAFEKHFGETKEQVRRLDRCFKVLGISPKKRTNNVTKQLLISFTLLLKEIEKSELRDVALIGYAQKVEHYEITSYGTARSLARLLGLYEVGNILKETLAEKEAADSTLNRIAEGTFLTKGLNAIALKKQEETELFGKDATIAIKESIQKKKPLKRPNTKKSKPSPKKKVDSNVVAKGNPKTKTSTIKKTSKGKRPTFKHGVKERVSKGKTQ